MNLGLIVEEAIDVSSDMVRFEIRSREKNLRYDMSKLMHKMQERIDALQRPALQDIPPDS